MDLREMAKEMKLDLDNPGIAAELSAAEVIVEQMARVIVTLIGETGIGVGCELKVTPQNEWSFEHWCEDSMGYSAKWTSNSIGGLAVKFDEYPEGE